MDHGCVMSVDLPAAGTNSHAKAAASSCYNEHVQHFSTNHKHGVGAVAANNCSSSTESQSGTWPASKVLDQENVLPALHVMPDFSQAYNFLGSVFDPDTNGHLQSLKEMDPIDVETLCSCYGRRLLRKKRESADCTRVEEGAPAGRIRSETHVSHDLPIMRAARARRTAARLVLRWKREFQKILFIT